MKKHQIKLLLKAEVHEIRIDKKKYISWKLWGKTYDAWFLKTILITFSFYCIFKMQIVYKMGQTKKKLS
jgi:hypothetical protein